MNLAKLKQIIAHYEENGATDETELFLTDEYDHWRYGWNFRLSDVEIINDSNQNIIVFHNLEPLTKNFQNEVEIIQKILPNVEWEICEDKDYLVYLRTQITDKNLE